ncbi:retrotransposon protein, putative, ty1-copia subclass [Tanacetum coccineum]
MKKPPEIIVFFKNSWSKICTPTKGKASHTKEDVASSKTTMPANTIILLSQQITKKMIKEEALFNLYSSLSVEKPPRKFLSELICKIVTVPDPFLITESKLGSDGDPVSDPTLYRSFAGALQYLTFTCPDLTYAVQQDIGKELSVYLAELQKKRSKLALQVLREIDIHESCKTKVNSIYNVSNKRVKHNLDSTYLWHCRLAHINKKRIKQLQQDGLLKSTDDESFDKCESCLSGKMTKKPFPHSNERAKDLLGIIHTDVCGPLRHVSRQGASYFITFTDDYSRYGYVYLLKHKHEVFETFKVFKNEVENQLWNTSKLTPPYTPQHNGVSERRNRTLLDMVRSNEEYYCSAFILLGLCFRVCNTHSQYGFQQEGRKTTYELCMEKVPNFVLLKGLGCEALVKRDTLTNSNKDLISVLHRIPQSEPMVYYFYFHLKNKIVVARHLDECKPEGFVDPNHPRKVCKLQRSIYGLKQASRSWNKRFDEEIKRFGFTQNLDEPCVYQKASGSEPHWTAMKNILKYLRNTKDMFLVYGGNPSTELRVELLLCDAGFETDRDDTKSQTGYVFVLNGGAVDWKSSKQSTTAMSAIESEYIAASEAAMEAVWIRKFISGLGIVPTINEPLNMYCDNSAHHYAIEPSSKAPDTIKDDILMFTSVVELAK